MVRTYYFDYAAATPVDIRVLKAMEPFWQDRFYNPSALYTSARAVRNEIEASRSKVAGIIGAKPYEVIFTAGATESINLAICGIKQAKKSANIVISAIEHEAVAKAAAKSFSSRVKICPVNQGGLVNLAALEKLIDQKTILISIMHVNNEIGTIEPLAKIRQLIDKIRKTRLKNKNNLPLIFHTDAAQSPNYLPLNVTRLGIDLMSLNGGKIYGPKQSGCLYVRSGIEIEPIIVGGGQERGLRGGTENVASIIGFTRALEIAQADYRQETKRVLQLRDYARKSLNQKIKNLQINGSIANRIANNLNITIPGISGEMLVHHLDAAGIFVATGAACSAIKDLPSATLLAIGLSKAHSNSSLRITLGRASTKDEIDVFVKELAITIKRLRELAK